MKAKLLAIFLVLAMLAPSLVACGGTPEDTEPNSPVQTETDISEEFPDTLPLVTDGASEYVIVRSENAAEQEILAASELQRYLKQITGAELPVVTDSIAAVGKEIVVGHTNREGDGAFDREELGTDGFIIKTDAGKLWLIGGGEYGTLYAVYEFLEAYLGCRFYTATFEKIPEVKTVSLKIEEDKQVPVFETRHLYWSDMMNSPDLQNKLKMRVAGSWAGGMCHTLPELAETGGGYGPDPCLFDENVYQTVLKNVKARLDANPSARYISISQSDGTAVYCHCNTCMDSYAELGYSGHYLQFVNRIAAAIKDEYPNVMIHTFAYIFTVTPPKTDIAVADNVMVQFCTIEGCFSHTLRECLHVDTGHIPEGQNFADMLEAWSGICDFLSIWDYTTDFGDYNLPFGNFHVLLDNVRLFADNNVKYLFEQGGYQATTGEFCELRTYLLARVAWNPYMTDEEYYALMDEFLVDYYGPGWESIRAYIDCVCENVSANVHMGIWDGTSELFPFTTDDTNKSRELPVFTADQLRNYKDIDWTQYYDWLTVYIPHEVLSKGYTLFAEAMEKAETEEQRTHIDKSSIQLDYINSYFLYDKYNRQYKATLNKIFNNALKVCVADGSLTQEESDSIKNGFKEDVLSVLTEEYAEYNRALINKMISYRVFYICESGNISVGPDNLNLYGPPGGAGAWTD